MLFFADENEAEEEELVAGVNRDKYRSGVEQSRGEWVQKT